MLYYDAVLKPSFLYGSSVWSSTSKANLDSILRLQKRAERVIILSIGFFFIGSRT